MTKRIENYGMTKYHTNTIPKYHTNTIPNFRYTAIRYTENSVRLIFDIVTLPLLRYTEVRKVYLITVMQKNRFFTQNI